MDLFNTWIVENYIAHRGLHNEIYPENSIGAFENAIENHYPIELDVHLLKDKNIAVFHDDCLSRITGKDGYIKNLTKNDLKDYKLNGTDYCIPTLDEVLQLVNGRTPILIEIKNSGKVGEFEEILLSKLKEYNGDYAIQSFNPFVLKWFKDHAPNILRGQLAGFLKDSNLNFFKKFFLKRMSFNKKISEPHFISYEAKALPNRFVNRFKTIPLLAWTVESQEQYMQTVKYCDNIIFQNFIPKI